MSNPAGTLSVSEAADEEALAADRKNMSQKVNGSANPDVQVVDAAHKLAATQLGTPGLSPPNGATPESESELHSPQALPQIRAPSASHLHPMTAVAESPTGEQVSLNETPGPRMTGQYTGQYTGQSIAASAGSRGAETGGFLGSKSVSDQAFPFPNVRPISSSNSPNPNGNPSSGMNIPPVSGSSSAVMSRNPSGHSVSGHFGKSTKPLKTPTAEMKGFFQKMFHTEPKHDKNHDKDARQQPHLDLTKDKHGGFASASGHSSPRGSPGPPSRDLSPPGTPGTPPHHPSDSEYSRPPSRAPSVSRRDSNSRPQTPPVPAPSLARRMSGKSSKPEKPAKPVAVVNGQPVVVGQKQEVTAASGTKFTLKDLIGLGENPKLSRKQSSYKGSDRGSTKGGSDRGDGDNGSTASLLKKYGVCDKAAIGKGATAVVRLAHKWDRREEKLYAVKEFRKRRKNETEKDYVKKLTSEFCISSTLHHPNIVETVDLVQDEAQHWCEVMEYCPGGDLYAAIKKGGMSSGEVECSFKQVLLGIQYLHSMGVAHRDIKPENLLLDGRGHVKITDFGVSDVFRMCWEKKTHLSKGLCGSEPYIAPELFEQKEYDARQVDVWAAAVVFYCMQFQELPWRVAKNTDPTYSTYRSQYTLGTAESASATPAPLNNLVPRECRSVIKHMLDPDPKTRWSIEDALADKWMQGIKVCKEGEIADHAHTTTGLDIVKGV